MAFNWENYEIEQSQNTAPQESSFNWNAYEMEQPTVTQRIQPSSEWKQIGQNNPEEFKKNIDIIYNIPQVEMPRKGVLTNSNGIVKEGQTPFYSSDKQAELDRIKREYEARNKEINRQARRGYGRIGLGAAMQGASLHPIFNIPYIGTGIGGALFDAGGAIIEGTSCKDIAKRAGEGFVIGETIGAIPYVGKLAGKTKVGSAIGAKMNEAARTALESKLGQGIQRVLATEIIPQIGKKNATNIVKEVQAEILTLQAAQQLEREAAAIPPVEFRQSRLSNNAELPVEIEQAVKEAPPEYQVLHNKDIINQAEQELYNVGVNDIAEALRNQETFSALDFEKARQTISKLYQEGRIQEAINLTEKVAGKGSEAGQAVQAMSLWSKTTPEGAVKQAQKIINEYNQRSKKPVPKLSEEQALELRTLTENIQKAAEGREKDIATAQLMKYFNDLVPQSAGNKLKSLRNISLLLNPKTFMRNLTGNAIFAGMENLATKPIAAGVDVLASLITKNRTRSLPQFMEYGKGFKKGVKEGIEDVKLGIDTRKGIGGRFDMPQQRSFSSPILGGAETALDYSLRVPDRAFYQASFDEALANQMKAAGVSEPTEAMFKNAYDEAMESVYQNKGMLGDTVLGLRGALNNVGIKNFGLGDALIPYAQTPANVVQQGINYSPLGFGKAAYNFAQGNQRQATLDTARGLVGSGIMGGGYALAKNGLMNSDMEDYKVRKNYEAMGIRPNTINMPNGENFSIAQLQPLASPVLGGAALADIQNGGFKQAGDRALGAIADLSMLQGLNNFTKDYNDDGLFTATTNLAASLPSQFVPTALNTVNSFVDPYQRETYDSNPSIQGLNQIKAKTLGLSYTLPVKYDVTGKPIQKFQREGLVGLYDKLVNPVFINKQNDDNTLKELTNLYEATDDKGVLLTVADKNISYIDSNGNRTNRKLNGEELSTYQHELGAISKVLLDNFVTSPEYAEMSENERIAHIEKLKRAANEAVKIQRFGHTPKNKLSKYSRYVLENYDSLLR